MTANNRARGLRKTLRFLSRELDGFNPQNDGAVLIPLRWGPLDGATAVVPIPALLREIRRRGELAIMISDDVGAIYRLCGSNIRNTAAKFARYYVAREINCGDPDSP